MAPQLRLVPLSAVSLAPTAAQAAPGGHTTLSVEAAACSTLDAGAEACRRQLCGACTTVPLPLLCAGAVPAMGTERVPWLSLWRYLVGELCVASHLRLALDDSAAPVAVAACAALLALVRPPSKRPHLLCSMFPISCVACKCFTTMTACSLGQGRLPQAQAGRVVGCVQVGPSSEVTLKTPQNPSWNPAGGPHP